MKFAVYTPNFGPLAEPRVLAETAREAEEAGWDGFFIWDHVLWTYPENHPTYDPWVALAAIATVTHRIRLGVLVTPVARRRPWKLAREAVTLDHLSGGRLVLGVGSGHDMFKEYSAFGESTDLVTHGEMLDEGLEVISGLWSGEPFSYEGKHYHIREAHFLPGPVQQPRIPVWVAGMWPYKKPLRRSARWDGVVPIGTKAELTPDDIRVIGSYVREHRTSQEPFDIVCSGTLLAGDDDAIERAAAFEAAGATWWLEHFVPWDKRSVDEQRDAVRNGPPVR
jgi:alkanesulfonate monooxygenase SsuD/methylene tetrahydromethanopterin reductase-like flavin-dependent oxidoreductase (luciferase family)